MKKLKGDLNFKTWRSSPKRDYRNISGHMQTAGNANKAFDEGEEGEQNSS